MTSPSPLRYGGSSGSSPRPRKVRRGLSAASPRKTATRSVWVEEQDVEDDEMEGSFIGSQAKISRQGKLRIMFLSLGRLTNSHL